MNHWTEHQPALDHDGGPNPCPDFLIVDVWFGPANRQETGEAHTMDWPTVRFWRPADPVFECMIENNRVIAYRKKVV